MGVNAPAAGLLSEVREHDSWRLERPVAVTECRPNAGLTEADDVGATVAGEVRQQARVAIDPPARGIGTDGHVRHAVAADRTRNAELPLGGLRPLKLRPRLAAVFGDPKVARKGARDDEGTVIRTRERKHPPAHKPRRR